MPVINPWKYEYIRQLAEEATILAKRDGLRPALATEVVMTYKRTRRLNIPNLGDYVPEGWTRVNFIEPVFVDITGIARPGEFTGISKSEFFQRALHTAGLEDKQDGFVLGYGVIEMGQTQALVAAYRRNT